LALLQIPKKVLWVHPPDFGMQPLRKLKKCLVSTQQRKSSRPIVKLCQYNCINLCTHLKIIARLLNNNTF
jgi:hypothetical protein